MIIVTPLNGEPAEYFENYNELFECFTEMENMKLLEVGPDHKRANWSFTVYPPKRAFILYANISNPPDAMKEAAEENFPLIEICTGDYATPAYITFTPNTDMDYLKKKWCTDYCTWYNFLLREV